MMVQAQSMARFAALVAAVLIAAPALAESAPDGTVVRLSPKAAEQAIESGAASAVSDEDMGMIEDGYDRRIHGEVGMMIGTGGARGMFGTAAIPLGDDAGAIVSFSAERYGGRTRRYRR